MKKCVRHVVPFVRLAFEFFFFLTWKGRQVFSGQIIEQFFIIIIDFVLDRYDQILCKTLICFIFITSIIYFLINCNEAQVIVLCNKQS